MYIKNTIETVKGQSIVTSFKYSILDNNKEISSSQQFSKLHSFFFLLLLLFSLSVQQELRATKDTKLWKAMIACVLRETAHRKRFSIVNNCMNESTMCVCV